MSSFSSKRSPQDRAGLWLYLLVIKYQRASSLDRITIVLDLTNRGAEMRVDLPLDLRTFAVQLECPEANRGESDVKRLPAPAPIDLVGKPPDLLVHGFELLVKPE